MKYIIVVSLFFVCIAKELDVQVNTYFETDKYVQGYQDRSFSTSTRRGRLCSRSLDDSHGVLAPGQSVEGHWQTNNEPCDGEKTRPLYHA